MARKKLREKIAALLGRHSNKILARPIDRVCERVRARAEPKFRLVGGQDGETVVAPPEDERLVEARYLAAGLDYEEHKKERYEEAARKETARIGRYWRRLRRVGDEIAELAEKGEVRRALDLTETLPQGSLRRAVKRLLLWRRGAWGRPRRKQGSLASRLDAGRVREVVEALGRGEKLTARGFKRRFGVTLAKIRGKVKDWKPSADRVEVLNMLRKVR
jgi:ribosomal protein S24E